MVDIRIAVALRHRGPVVAHHLGRVHRIVQMPLVEQVRVADIGKDARLRGVHGVEVED